MRILNLGKAKTIPKLNEANAIETGAQLLSEFIILSIASSVLIYEYRRSSEKEDAKQAELEREKELISDKVMALEMSVAEHRAQITELKRLAHSLIDDKEKGKWRKSAFFGGAEVKTKDVSDEQVQRNLSTLRPSAAAPSGPVLDAAHQFLDTCEGISSADN